MNRILDLNDALPDGPGGALSPDWRWPHFYPMELACRCDRASPSERGTSARSPGCRILLVDPRLLDLLERLRKALGSVPVEVTSGYRCPARNHAVGGRPDSIHLLGKAADVICRSVPFERLAREVAALSPPGLGIYRARRFVHVDVRENGPARWSA